MIDTTTTPRDRLEDSVPYFDNGKPLEYSTNPRTSPCSRQGHEGSSKQIVDNYSKTT